MPIGGYIPKYHFIVVTDPNKKMCIAKFYRRSIYEEYLPYRETIEVSIPEIEERWLRSAVYLAKRLHDILCLNIPCVDGRDAGPTPWTQASSYAQILPMTWSLMLAFGTEGLAPVGQHFFYGTRKRSLHGGYSRGYDPVGPDSSSIFHH